MKLLLLVFLVFPLLLFNSCKDDKEETSKKETISFGGITSTDEFGFPISIDATDWRLSESWSGKENYLFIQKMDELSFALAGRVTFRLTTESKLFPCNNPMNQCYLCSFKI